MSSKETEEGNRKEAAKDRQELWEAIRCGLVEEVRRLLSTKSLDVNSASNLSLAAQTGNRDIVLLLLDAGANINRPGTKFNRKHRRNIVGF